jgi:hypothetical protein
VCVYLLLASSSSPGVIVNASVCIHVYPIDGVLSGAQTTLRH